jgi:poly(3-hydroxybutyrate) depolymerase
MKAITSVVLLCGGGLLLAGVLAHQTQAQPLNTQIYAQRPTGWQAGTLTQGTTTRYFRYYLPRNLPKNAPVVILMVYLQQEFAQTGRSVYHLKR